MTWRCNGIAECANGEDEKLCGKSMFLFLHLFIPLLKFLLSSLHILYLMVLCVIKSHLIFHLSMCTNKFFILYIYVS
jgi:Low-density lipoprotein receptor domain class A.